jgi:chitinase
VSSALFDRTCVKFHSAAAKGNFITQEGLAGFALWEMGGDYNNILLNAITGAIGGSS